MRLVCCVLAMFAGVGGLAWAESPRWVEPEPAPPSRTRVGLAFTGGPMLLGPVSYGTMAGEVELGRRFGPVWLLGRGSWGRADRPETMEQDGGTLWRHGAAVRLPLARLGLDRIGGGLQFWADGGAGRRHLRWDAGGRLVRDETALGLGFDGEGSFGGGRYVTFGMSMRALFAESVDGRGVDPGMLMVIRMGWQQ